MIGRPCVVWTSTGSLAGYFYGAVGAGGDGGGCAAEQESFDSAAKGICADEDAVGLPGFGLVNQDLVRVSLDNPCRDPEARSPEVLCGLFREFFDPLVLGPKFVLRPVGNRRNKPPDRRHRSVVDSTYQNVHLTVRKVCTKKEMI